METQDQSGAPRVFRIGAETVHQSANHQKQQKKNNFLYLAAHRSPLPSPHPEDQM